MHPGDGQGSILLRRKTAAAVDLTAAAFLRRIGSRSESRVENTAFGTKMERYGIWENALAKAALPKPTAPDRPSGFLCIREETQRQKLIYRQKKAEKKLRAQQRLRRE